MRTRAGDTGQGTRCAAVLVVALGLGARASAQEASQDPQAAAGQASAHWAWDGTPQDGATLLREIAAARVAMDVEGDLAEVERRLDALWVRATEVHGFEGQTEALVQVALARAELQRRLGKREAGLEELGQILLERLDPRGRRGAEVRVVPASNQLVLSMPAIEGDPRILAMRYRFEQDLEETPSAVQDSLREMIAKALDSGDATTLLQIGPPAFQPLAERLAGERDAFPNVGDDMLGILVRLDRRRAARWLEEGLDAGGPLWKRRIVRAMSGQNVLRSSWTESEPYVCLEPEWIELVQRLLEDPEVAEDVLPFFSEVEQHDSVTPGLGAAMARALGSHGPLFATAAMRVFDHPGVVPSAQTALEAALDLPDARLRRFAAEKLANLESSQALRAHADDPSAEVRRIVARALGEREGRTFRKRNYGNPVVTWLTPRLGPQDRPLVARLLADEDEEVRMLAVPLIDHLGAPLEPETIAALLEDRSVRVRSALVWVETLPAETRARVLERLAADPALEVVQALDQLFGDLFEQGANASFLGPMLPAIGVRLRDERRELEFTLRRSLRQNLLLSAEGTRVVVESALACPTPEAFSQIGSYGKVEHFVALPDELLARMLSSQSQEPWQVAWSRLQAGNPARPGAMRLVLTDVMAPRRERLRAAGPAMDGSKAGRDAFLAFLQGSAWDASPPDDGETKSLRACAQRLDPAERNALALEVLRDARISHAVADPLVSSYSLDGSGRTLTCEILERWFVPEEPARNSVSVALERLGSFPDLAQPELLERGLLRPEYASAVVEALGALGNPAHLDLLERALKADWMPSSGRSDLQQEAAAALASFDDERAVGLLLSGLRSNDSRVRGVCQDSLERIRTYRDQVRAWRERGVAPVTRSSALAELVEMLDESDPLVRREAALGLATLGSVESLPRLIRLLKDPEASVRTAAQEAIDRLHAAAPAPAASPASPPEAPEDES